MPKRRKIDVDALRAWSYTAEQKEIGEAKKIIDTAIKARFPVERKKREKKTAEVVE